MAVGINDAALIGLHGHEGRRVLVEVGHLLGLPPAELVAKAVVVVAAADPVHRAGVQTVAPDVLQHAVLIGVGRVLRVPVELAADDLQLLAARLDAGRADAGDVGGLVGMDRHERGFAGRRVGRQVQAESPGCSALKRVANRSLCLRFCVRIRLSPL